MDKKGSYGTNLANNLIQGASFFLLSNLALNLYQIRWDSGMTFKKLVQSNFEKFNQAKLVQFGSVDEIISNGCRFLKGTPSV